MLKELLVEENGVARLNPDNRVVWRGAEWGLGFISTDQGVLLCEVMRLRGLSPLLSPLPERPGRQQAGSLPHAILTPAHPICQVGHPGGRCRERAGVPCGE